MKELLEEALRDCSHYKQNGAVASYIPELSHANRDDFGICVISEGADPVGVGDYFEKTS